jgi:aspartyl-tRNA(Asn)/glutamyl-tRNA(Gln) amidotransferase subunit B
MNWETVIGLEIHTQLATQSKIFSGERTTYGAEPNTQACLVDLGYPGVLPVLNSEAVAMAVKFGLAIEATIERRSVFARKNYFYPDLPKGYQISQYELPIVSRGSVVIQLDDGSQKRVGITRAHLEEDAGKSLHETFKDRTGIDLNRAGTPLLEIVSEPELSSAAEAAAYMRKIHQLVRYLGISDGNMQEGSFRCDANISVRPSGDTELGTRAELKNLNSFRYVEKAIEFEIERQIDVLEDGGKVVQETRLYDSDKDETRPMRGKEEANDYRYFPDPDLLPLELDEALLDSIKESMPELPSEKERRFAKDYGLNPVDIQILTASSEGADFFEASADGLDGNFELAANWNKGELRAALNRNGLTISESPVSGADLNSLLCRISDGTISGKTAKEVFEAMWAGEGNADQIIEARGLQQITDVAALEKVVQQVVADNPEQAGQYRAGKQKLLGFFVGQVMQATGGKANPTEVNKLLRARLDADEN